MRTPIGAVTRYYNEIAPDYDHQMTSPGVRWARDAFRDLVRDMVAPPAHLLDFGCGTGLDAIWYAAHDYRVTAFDLSAGMIEQLRRRARPFLEQGTISTSCCGLEDFLDRLVDQPRPDAIVSNFAVFNLIDDVSRVMDALVRHVRPGGHIVISVLNPFFWKDARFLWWWRAAARSMGRTAMLVPSLPASTYRHRISFLRRLAGRSCTLVAHASAGALVRRHRRALDWELPRTLTERTEKHLHRHFPIRHLGQFTFLAFRRIA